MNGTGGASVWLCWRTQIRHRRWSILAFGAVLGLIVSVSLGTAAAARRTQAAYPGLQAATRPADAVAFASTPNPQIPTITVESIEALPEVGEAGRIRVFDGFDTTAHTFANAFGSIDGNAFSPDRGVNQLHLRAGRPYDPQRADEVLVDYSVANRDRLQVGSRLTLQLAAPGTGVPQWIPDLQNAQSFTFHVVGIVATPGQFPPETGFYWSGPATYLTPAFLRAHGEDLSWYQASVVRLRQRARPARTLDAFTNDLSDSAGFEPVVIPIGEQSTLTQHSFHLQVVALWVLAGLLGLAALMVLVDLLVRQVALDSQDWPTLRALGMGRGALVGLGLLGTATTGLVAAGFALVGGLLVSPLAPLGVARYAEVHPGLSFDGRLLGLGAVGLVAVMLTAAAFPLIRSARGAELLAGAGAVPARPGRVARLGRALPVSAQAGVRMALEPGEGRTAVPVRSTLGAGVVGVAALVAALTFGVSLQHLVSTPRLYGVTWDVEILNDNGPGADAAGIPIVASDPSVAAQAWVYGPPGNFGRAKASIQVLEPLKGAMHPVILSGREPVAADEVALGSRTMATAHVKIGDRLEATAIQGGARLSVRVVGRAVLEPGDSGGSLGTGASMTLDGLNRLAQGTTTFPPFILAVRFKPGVNVARASAALNNRLQAADPSFNISAPEKPGALVDFGQVNYLPYLTGGLLGVVALLVLIHLVVTAVRRRRRDLAILKTLGFTRGQVRASVLWQATSLAAACLLFGVPIGIAFGRWLWNLLATQQGILPQPVAPALLIAAALAGLLIVANVVSLIPAAIAGRTRPALVLRSE